MKISSEGVQLNVTDIGVGDVTLVFLHFWGGSSLTWNEVISRLSNKFRCVAIDARGSGASHAPTDGYSMTDHASDVANVVQSLDLRRFVLVGHSMGGKTSQLLASMRPDGLAGLVLIASSPLSPMQIDDAQREQMRNAYASRSAIESTIDSVLVGSPISSAARARLVGDAMRLSPQAKSGWLDVGSREDFSDRAAEIDVPVLIVFGDVDRVDPIPVVKTHILPHFPSAQVHLLPNRGHLLPVEAPETLATLIGDFVI